MARSVLSLLCLSWTFTGVGAADVCEGGCREGEESALLQVPTTSHTSIAGCVHGTKKGNVCVCSDGWGGDACDTPEELVVPKTKPVAGDACGIGFTVYPYGQQDLWGTAYDGWEECAGMKQSPINVVSWTTPRKTVRRPLKTSYSMDSSLYVKNTGSGLKVPGSWGSVTIKKTVFNSAQFHFHAPSEHAVNGLLAAAEMHIVHLNAEGTAAAVVGIMFDIGKKNECLETILSNPVPKAGCKRDIEDIDLNCFKDQLEGPWWNYEGSLTTPPCNEIVNWNLLQRRAEISQNQLDKLTKRYKLVPGNARSPQPLNGRKVVLYDPVDLHGKAAKSTAEEAEEEAEDE